MRMARMPGAVKAASALLLGVLAAQWLPALPPPALAALPALVVLIASRRWPRLRLPALVLLGAAWVVWRGTLALDLRLARELEGQDFDIVGTVAGLPQARDGATRFVLDVEDATLAGKPV